MYKKAKLGDHVLYLGDCLEIMPKLKMNSIDMIFADLPYGATACKWDSIIPLDILWRQYKRVIKIHGAITLTASQPFTSVLVVSNLEMFKYEWIWEKAVGSNFASLKYQPMKEHESILIFGEKSIKYRPIKEPRKGAGLKRLKTPYHTNSKQGGDVYDNIKRTNAGKEYDELRNPSSVQYFNNRASGDRGLHPTQKPVLLCKYFIETYTKENDLVLDNVMGSGSTGEACIKTNRKFIGIEKDEKYFRIAYKRLKSLVENEHDQLARNQ